MSSLSIRRHCSTLQLRNVTERLPQELAGQVKATMHVACKLGAKQGIAKLKQQARWLQAQHPDAAASLLEGLEETFTINALKLPGSLQRSLATTNIIENPNGAVRKLTRRVARYHDAKMALRWAAAGFLEAEKHLRKLYGHQDLWMLKSALGRSDQRVDAKPRAA